MPRYHSLHTQKYNTNADYDRFFLLPRSSNFTFLKKKKSSGQTTEKQWTTKQYHDISSPNITQSSNSIIKMLKKNEISFLRMMLGQVFSFVNWIDCLSHSDSGKFQFPVNETLLGPKKETLFKGKYSNSWSPSNCGGEKCVLIHLQV